MKVLVACEYSGRVRQAFRSRGHEAYSCDLIESEDNSPHHFIGDALYACQDYNWDLLIAHPPCTFLANSGAKHLYNADGNSNVERLEQMHQAAAFFRALWQQPIGKICIENPIMMLKARELIGCGKPTQVFQPYNFGHMESKQTCLWLKGLPRLFGTKQVYKEMLLLPEKERNKVHWASPGPNRWKDRSRTYQGVADAMGIQWGSWK